MDGALMIDWFSEKNEILLNPRMSEGAKQNFLQSVSCLKDLNRQVCLATSGTSGTLKLAVLSKEAILASAQAVNKHLESHSSDLWLNSLPDFHVGGLGIIARGYLSDTPVITCHFPFSKWSPEHFFKQLELSQATLTSLVPTQVYDLISCDFKAPPALRGIVVGGGSISEKLYFKAVSLGWKLLPSYGLTECASQVATAKMGSWNLFEYPLLSPLSHVSLEENEEGYLKIKSKSLLTGYIESDGTDGFILRDPKVGGWLTTEDKALFERGCIKSVSRGEHFVKIGGESVDLLRLQRILEEEKLALQLSEDVALVAMADARLGSLLHLAVASPLNDNIKKLMDAYSHRVFPFEKICFVHCMNRIPRSPLNKVLKSELEQLIAEKLAGSRTR